MNIDLILPSNFVVQRWEIIAKLVMLKKGFDILTAKIGQLGAWRVFGLIFTIAFFVRFPFFFRDYIDRDESTFILIGQSWVDGYLPYTQLWDVKPPITFLFFAGIIAAFGKSFLAIRFFGTLLVVFTALFTYKITALLSSKKVAFWSAVACVFLQSAFGSVQGVMSEHICMTFFMAGLFILIRYNHFLWYLVAGLLMGISVMVKLNMAYAILFVGFFILYEAYLKKEFLKGVFDALGFGVAILLVILLTFLPYYFDQIGDLWWKSVVRAPLEYAEARRYSLLKMAPTFLTIIGFFVIAWRTKHLNFKDTSIQLLLLASFGVLLSFVKGGRINSHYLIQLYPIILVPVAIVVSKFGFLERLKTRAYWLLLLLPVESYLEYYAIGKHKIEKGNFFNGEGFTVPQYIKNNSLETKNILFTEYHIGYWILGVVPPTKAATHPSNICKPEMFQFYDNPRKTGLDEIEFILENLKPVTVVVRHNRSIFDKKLIKENAYINRYLSDNYEPLEVVDGALIYQRLER